MMIGLEELECFFDFVLIVVLEVLCELVVLVFPVFTLDDVDIADAATVWEEVLLICVDFDFVLCLALDLEWTEAE